MNLEEKVKNHFKNLFQKIDQQKDISKDFSLNATYLRIFNGKIIRLNSRHEILNFYQNKGKIRRNLQGIHLIGNILISNSNIYITGEYKNKIGKNLLFTDYHKIIFLENEIQTQERYSIVIYKN